MAEGVLFTFAGEMLGKLSSHALQQLGMVIGVEDDLKRLKSNVSAIQAVVADAEERPNKSRSLKDWLQKLEEALYDADDVLDEFSTEALRRQVMTRGKHAKQVRIFFSTSNQLAFNYKMSREIKKIRERLVEISEEKKEFGLNENCVPRMIQHGGGLSHQMGTHSALNEGEVVGRDDDKMRIKRLLLDIEDVQHNVSFIAIVGMGGIGKTTLAKLLYNDTEVSKHFDLKMWVWVSDQFDVNRVVEKMIESASGSKPNVQEMAPLGCKLQKLIEKKKYLLVMDDVWNESEEQWEQLKSLLMVGAADGSKILITKRDSIAHAEVGGMTKLINLNGLSDESCWSLFQKLAFKELGNQKMIQLGKEILKNCGGIPLVVKHIGRLLYSKFSEDEWSSFKNDELPRVTRENNDMTSILALSYKHLSPHLKQCFAYSSSYTKDAIHKDELLKEWVAHGFVPSRERSKSMEDIANDYFTELCWRFFYEHQDGFFVCMHDVMRDLGRMVAGTGYACGSLKDEDVGERIHHFSSAHDIESWNDLPPELHKAKGLRTFHMSNIWGHINEGVLDKLFSNFPHLRVLNLSWTIFRTLPDSLKKLRLLRYLNLSYNKFLISLPNSISELINLQTLYLRGCRSLTELPRDINKLLNLRHLELTYVFKLTHMPKGIGKLTCLQTLKLFVLDKNKEGSKLSELNELKDLRGWLGIKGLEQLRGNPSEARLANLRNKKGLRHLDLQWKPRWNEEETEDGLNDETTLEGLQLHPNVDSVNISWYKGERIPDWVANPLSKLTLISLNNCNRLQLLPQFDQLQALTSLNLYGLTSLQFIDNNNPGSSTSMFFPCLDCLTLCTMPNLEGWWEGESRVVVMGDEESEKRRDLLPNFARLTKLSVHDCPKLGWVPTQPSLKNVELDNVGVGMVRSIGPSSNLEDLTLKNIEDLQYLPIELLCSLSIMKLKISNCPSLPESAVPPFTSVDNNNNYCEDKRPSKTPDVIEDQMRNASSRPISIEDQIRRYKGEGLPNWVTDSVSKLTHITLINCNRLQLMPQLHQLLALTRLHLDGLTSLQFIDNNNPDSSSVFFPSLETLILDNMPSLEGWWEGESRVVEMGDEESEKRRDLLPNFAHLTKLSINECPKLGWVPRQPSLTNVELVNVGVGMVRSIGPSSNLEYVTLKNIEDLEYLPMELRCSLSIKKLEIRNCRSLRESAFPPFTRVYNV